MEPGAWSWVVESWAILPVAALAVMLRRWWVAGREPETRSVDVRYEPPGGLSPAEVGALRDGRPRLRHLTATLLDLEARGHLEIEEVEPPPDGSADRDFVLRPLSDPSTWDGLLAHERRLLHAVFSAPGAAQFLSASLAAVIVGGVGYAMPHRTEVGVRAAEEAAGFREFLARVEADRLEAVVEGPEAFDRYLAYAAALDVHNEWTPAFHDVYGGRVQTVEEDEADEMREMVGDMLAHALSGGGSRSPEEADPMAAGDPAGAVPPGTRDEPDAGDDR